VPKVGVLESQVGEYYQSDKRPRKEHFDGGNMIDLKVGLLQAQTDNPFLTAIFSLCNDTNSDKQVQYTLICIHVAIGFATTIAAAESDTQQIAWSVSFSLCWWEVTSQCERTDINNAAKGHQMEHSNIHDSKLD